MNIVQVTPNYLPTIGGVQKVVSELSSELVKRGHKVKIITGFDGKRSIPVVPGGAALTYLRSYEIAHTPIIPTLFFRLLNLPRESIIHVHVAKAFVPEIVYLISKIMGIPYIAHFHLDVGPSGKAGFLLPLYKNLILRRVLASAEKVIVFSKNYKNLLKNKYNLEKNVVIIPNGVDKKFFVKRNIAKKPVTNLLFVGRVSEQKQVHILIEALKFVKSKVILHIVGDGDLMPEIRSLLKKSRLNNVKLHGAKTEKELLKFYKNSDIFLLSSNKEGLPLVLLEAMAAGLPIIASDVIGTHEFVGSTGILVKPVSPENFAKEVDKVIKDKRLQRKLSRDSVNKAEKFLWSSIANKVEKVYESIKI